MKKRYLKIGTLSLVLGLALFSLSFMNGFSADSISESYNGGLLILKICLIAGFILVALAVGCFIVAAAAK